MCDFFLETQFHSVAPACLQLCNQLTATSASQVQAILLPQSPEELKLQAPATTPNYFFCIFLVKMGFHHVGQAGLKLLTSRESPASASQSEPPGSVLKMFFLLCSLFSLSSTSIIYTRIVPQSSKNLSFLTFFLSSHQIRWFLLILFSGSLAPSLSSP